MPPGEASKSLATFGRVVDRLLEPRVERRTAVIALGGGVVGDLAGFAAATALRGLPFVQIADHPAGAGRQFSVGGKTGINTAPRQEPARRLPPAAHGAGRHRRPGHPAAARAARRLRRDRQGRADRRCRVLRLVRDATAPPWWAATATLQAEAVLRACAFKAAVVGDDEREEKPNDGRALLNLGHTFGHALEAELGYGGACCTARRWRSGWAWPSACPRGSASARRDGCRPRRRPPRLGRAAGELRDAEPPASPPPR